MTTHREPAKLAKWYDAVSRDLARAIQQRTPARTPNETVERNALQKLYVGALRRSDEYTRQATR